MKWNKKVCPHELSSVHARHTFFVGVYVRIFDADHKSINAGNSLGSSLAKLDFIRNTAKNEAAATKTLNSKFLQYPHCNIVPAHGHHGRTAAGMGTAADEIEAFNIRA